MRKLIYLLLLIAAPFLLFAAVRGSIAVATHSLESRYPPPGEMVSVEGHRLHLYCMGSGAPAVIIEPGLGVDWVSWQRVFLSLAELTKVCVYDRAGYGWSEPGPEPRTAQQIAGELNGLLTNAKIPAPYILVAHSFGGFVARLYASRFGQSLSGMVLVDPSSEDEATQGAAQKAAETRKEHPLLSWVPPLGWQRLQRLHQGGASLPPSLRDSPIAFQNRVLVASSLEQLKSEESELESLPESESQARAASFPKDLRLTVVTATQRASAKSLSGTVPPRVKAHRDVQAKLARLSTRGQQIVAADSGHFVQVDQPEVVVNAIRDVIQQTRP